MDIDNIADLAGQLAKLGVADSTTELIGWICFQPQQFVLTRDFVFGGDSVQLRMLFVRSGEGGGYGLMHYDVLLDKSIALPVGMVHDVDIPALDSEMAGIKWAEAVARTRDTPVTLKEQESWKEEANIDYIISALKRLASDDRGKEIAHRLMRKHWPPQLNVLVPGFGQVLSGRPVFRQRFYTQAGQRLITLEEAYRFLLSKRFEEERRKTRGKHGALKAVQPVKTTVKVDRRKGQDKAKG